MIWHTPSFATAPQLQPEDLAECAERGFALVVNNRPDGEEEGQPTSADLQAEATKLGMQYAYLPITPGEMTDKEAREFADLVSGAEGPAIAFCRTGNRSEKLWNRATQLGLIHP